MTGAYIVAITVNGCTSAAGSTAVTVNSIPGTPTANGGYVMGFHTPDPGRAFTDLQRAAREAVLQKV